MKNLLGKIQYNAPVTLTFTLISLIVLLLGYITDGQSTTGLFGVYRSSWADPLTYVRLFTHVLGHANWSHYSANTVLLLVLGPMLEEKYKSGSILIMIGITALVSGVAHMLLFSGTVMLGASGIVFMMIVLSSVAGVKEGQIPLTLILVVIIYLGGELLSVGSKDGIAHMTHILGGLCGATFGLAGRWTKRTYLGQG